MPYTGTSLIIIEVQQMIGQMLKYCRIIANFAVCKMLRAFATLITSMGFPKQVRPYKGFKQGF